MNTKLHIDILHGVIDIEGDPDLVREIYADFKGQLLSGTKPVTVPSSLRNLNSAPSGDNDTDMGAKTKTRRRPAKKKVNGNDSVAGVVADAPKLDKNLDTAGLGIFYGQFLPKNNAEKILIFIKFLIDEIGIERPNTDQIYTCFKATGDKIPKAFAQAFYDTSTKQGYIDFRSPIDFPITIAGDNHFNHKLKRKAAE